MKKNTMMRLAAGILVLCLLTTCVISGTFAKYVTSNAFGGTAYVAEWGVTITAEDSLFLENYTTDDNSYAAQYSVMAGLTGRDLVAPGTSGSLADLSVSGTPEVAVEVSYSATVDLGDNWVYNSGMYDEQDSYYCPLIFKIGDTEYYGMDYASADEFEEVIENAVSRSAHYGPGNLSLSNSEFNSLSISWGWAYNAEQKEINGITFTTASNRNDDAKDTFLGNRAADENDANHPQIELIITASVTQID